MFEIVCTHRACYEISTFHVSCTANVFEISKLWFSQSENPWQAYFIIL